MTNRRLEREIDDEKKFRSEKKEEENAINYKRATTKNILYSICNNRTNKDEEPVFLNYIIYILHTHKMFIFKNQINKNLTAILRYFSSLKVKLFGIRSL